MRLWLSVACALALSATVIAQDAQVTATFGSATYRGSAKKKPPVSGGVVSNLTAVSHRAGQVDLVFDKNGLAGPFDIFKSASPITSLTGLTPILSVAADSWKLPWDDSTGIGNLQSGLILQTAGARLASTQALAVIPMESGARHYAVAQHGSTSFASAGPVTETPATPGLLWLESGWRQPNGAGTDRYRMAFQWDDCVNWDTPLGYCGHKFEVTWAASSYPLISGQFYPATLNLHGASGDVMRDPSGYLGDVQQIGFYVSPFGPQSLFWKGAANSSNTKFLSGEARRITAHLQALAAYASELQIDSNRLYATGGSMGGEAVHLAYDFPNVYAAAQGSIGIWTWDTVVGIACGTPAPSTGLPVDNTGIPVEQWWDTRNQAARTNAPPVILTFGTLDDSKQPCGGWNALAALDANKRAYLGDWQAVGHAQYFVSLDGHPYQFRFRKDEAYLAFSRATTNDAAGTSAGQSNERIDWQSALHAISGGAAITDTTTQFGISLIASGATATADVTIRNAQHFTPSAGQSVTWSVGSMSGSATVSADGSITIPNVLIPTTAIRLVVQ